VEVDYVREINHADGSKITGRKFENMNQADSWTVGTIANVTMGDPAVIANKYPFSADLMVGGAAATVTFDTYFFTVPTTVQNGNDTVTVPKNAMKFDVKIADWTFADPRNTLDVGLRLKSKGGKKLSKVNDKEEDRVGKDGQKKKHRKKRVDFGNMYFDTPLTAIYDGVEQPMNVTQETKGKSGKDLKLRFSFSSFTGGVVYDPVMGGEDEDSNAANSAGRTLPAMGLATVLAALAVI
jgi:hypothetical protein